MSSLGVDRSFLCSAPAAGFTSLPATRARRDQVLPAIQAFADWLAVTLVVSGVELARQFPAPQRFSGTTVSVSACIAALVVLLLGNDGAYRDDNGPLQIRQAERPVRAVAQASVLILLVNIAVGHSFPRGTIAISLLAAMPILMLEKLVLFVLIERLSSRALDARRAADGHWTQLILELSRSAQIKTEPELRGIRDEEVNTGGGWGYELSKRAFDAFLAVVFLAAALPLCLVVALLIFLDSPGPVLFRQERVGRDGRIFKIYKFRSMHVEASGCAVSPTSSADPRITGAGRWLRRCSLDELPQLLNVVRGEMSLVGPRPEMRFLVDQHRSSHRQRLQVPPGMTGLWQLSPARSARIHENPHYDLYYVRNRSFCMDLAILLYTPVRLMRGV